MPGAVNPVQFIHPANRPGRRPRTNAVSDIEGVPSGCPEREAGTPSGTPHGSGQNPCADQCGAAGEVHHLHDPGIRHRVPRSGRQKRVQGGVDHRQDHKGRSQDEDLVQDRFGVVDELRHEGAEKGDGFRVCGRHRKCTEHAGPARCRLKERHVPARRGGAPQGLYTQINEVERADPLQHSEQRARGGEQSSKPGHGRDHGHGVPKADPQCQRQGGTLALDQGATHHQHDGRARNDQDHNGGHKKGEIGVWAHEHLVGTGFCRHRRVLETGRNVKMEPVAKGGRVSG